jgi:F0F1-type ATP synthase membrane subunit b/b'
VKKENSFSEGEKKVSPQKTSASEAEDIYNETKKMVEELLENARDKSEQILLEGKLKAETLVEESKAEIEKNFEEAWNGISGR